MNNCFARGIRFVLPKIRGCAVIAAAWSLFFLSASASAATASPLFARGYTVIPAPQQVTLSGGDFEFTGVWGLELAPGVKADDVAVTSLKEALAERFHLALREAKGKGGPAVKLVIDAQAVAVGEAADRVKSALAEQAYRLKLAPGGIVITGNSPTGLFYGVQTLVQLLKAEGGRCGCRRGRLWTGRTWSCG